jgi:MSHA pilin protein MshC
MRRVSQHVHHGFTLIELIMVIVLLGILAVFAAPRIFSNSDFYARGFHDETLALLRYAQKTAIAQRRMVCVRFDTSGTPNTTTLTLENPTPVAAPMPVVTCGTDVAGPRGDSPARVTAGSGVTYFSVSTAQLIFDGLGQPVDTSRVALTSPWTAQVASGGSAIAQQIRVEAGTGYVHD